MPRGQKPYLKRSKVPLYDAPGFSESVMGPRDRKNAAKIFKPLQAAVATPPVKTPRPALDRGTYIDDAVDAAVSGKKRAQHRPSGNTP